MCVLKVPRDTDAENLTKGINEWDPLFSLVLGLFMHLHHACYPGIKF